MGNSNGSTLGRPRDDFVGASANDSIKAILSLLTIPLRDRLHGGIFEPSSELSNPESEGTKNSTSKSHFWQGKYGIFELISEQGYTSVIHASIDPSLS